MEERTTNVQYLIKEVAKKRNLKKIRHKNTTENW